MTKPAALLMYLMGGISFCLRYIKEQGETAFRKFWQNLQQCRKSLEDLRVLRLIGKELKNQEDIFDFDDSKIVISTAWADLSGSQLHRILRERYHLEMEMEAEQYVLALTSVMAQQGRISEIDRSASGN